MKVVFESLYISYKMSLYSFTSYISMYGKETEVRKEKLKEDNTKVVLLANKTRGGRNDEETNN